MQIKDEQAILDSLRFKSLASFLIPLLAAFFDCAEQQDIFEVCLVVCRMSGYGKAEALLIIIKGKDCLK